MGLHIPNLNPDKVLDKSAGQNCRKILNVKMQPWIYAVSILKVSTIIVSTNFKFSRKFFQTVIPSSVPTKVIVTFVNVVISSKMCWSRKLSVFQRLINRTEQANFHGISRWGMKFNQPYNSSAYLANALLKTWKYNVLKLGSSNLSSGDGLLYDSFDTTECKFALLLSCIWRINSLNRGEDSGFALPEDMTIAVVMAI